MNMKVLLVSSNSSSLTENISAMVRDKMKLSTVGFVGVDSGAVSIDLDGKVSTPTILDELYIAARKHPAFNLSMQSKSGMTVSELATENIIGIIPVHQSELIAIKDTLNAQGANVKIAYVTRDSELANCPVVHYKGSKIDTPAAEYADFSLAGHEASLIASQLIQAALTEFSIADIPRKADLALHSLLSSSPLSQDIDSIALLAERSGNRVKSNAQMANSLVEKIIDYLELFNESSYEALPKSVRDEVCVDAYRKLQITSYDMQNIRGGSPIYPDNFQSIINFAQFCSKQVQRTVESEDLLQVFAIAEHIDNSFTRTKYAFGRDRNLLPRQLVTALQEQAELKSVSYASEIVERMAATSDGIGVKDMLNSPAKTLFYQASSDFAVKISKSSIEEPTATQSVKFTM